LTTTGNGAEISPELWRMSNEAETEPKCHAPD
jgi:hypothetical protein